MDVYRLQLHTCHHHLLIQLEVVPFLTVSHITNKHDLTLISHVGMV